ncbi:MAG: hypothetical protein AAFV53_32435, partial [Myxococcota bacterium]
FPYTTLPICYALEMTTTFVPFPGDFNYPMYFGWGDLEPGYGQRAILSAFAAIQVDATGDGSNDFSCTGYIYGLAYGTGDSGNLGLRYISRDLINTVDYAFQADFNTADDSLRWNDDCPIEALPPFQWGFYANNEGFFARRGGDDDDWSRQYRAYVISTYFEPPFEATQGLGGINQIEPATWNSRYD